MIAMLELTTADAVPPVSADKPSNVTSPVQPITVSSTRADVHVSRLDGNRIPVAAVINNHLLGMNALEAVELLRALTAALPRCGYCGESCEVDYCTDRDCRRLDASCESAWRDGFESHPVGFTRVGKAA